MFQVMFKSGLKRIYFSDFRNKSNGIFVLGVDFFLQTNFKSYHSKRIVVLSLNLKRYFTCNRFC